MPKSVTVTLAGVEYVVPKLNVGQIEEIVMNRGKGRPFDALRVALLRAEPKVADLDAIEADPAEIAAAVGAVLELAGIERKDAEKNADSPAPPSG